MATKDYPALNLNSPDLYLRALKTRCMADTAYWNRHSGATVHTLPPPPPEVHVPNMYSAAVEELAADCR